METANIQSVAEKNIVSVALANIQPSSYNPRKYFDEVMFFKHALESLGHLFRKSGGNCGGF